ncbi:hypothetical protein HMPREF9102_2105 [Limosilactobacillus oris F0423]|uniref:Uncharacterized protein n=1 Tax=Limosilactobacillus oris F0423 TaxID=944562 RepID=A0ABN0D3Z6_9LACO|nr:hypothetical protein HMPREF9102_2105 [Limosilactobacillus oris F0423]
MARVIKYTKTFKKQFKKRRKAPSGVQYLKVHYLKSLMIKSGVLGNILFSV